MTHDEMIAGRGLTAANLAVGWQRLIGPTAAVSIGLFSYILFAPLLVTRIAFIRRNEIVLAQIAKDLYRTDPLLFIIVFGFGIDAPITKMGASVAVWYFINASRARSYSKLLILLGKHRAGHNVARCACRRHPRHWDRVNRNQARTVRLCRSRCRFILCFSRDGTSAAEF